MSSRLSKIRKSSLSLRLTIYFAVFFTVASLLIFILAWLSISPGLLRDLDGFLSSEAKEVEVFWGRHGLEPLKISIREEAHSHGVSQVFFRLLSPQLNVLAYSDPRHWQELGFDTALISALSRGETALATVSLPAVGKEARAIYRRFNDNHVVQIVHIIALDELFMSFSRGFLLVWATMLATGGVLCWFLIRKAMRGVEQVSAAAEMVGGGSFAQQVQPIGEGREIRRLVQAFNEMSTQIHRLFNELSEVTSNIAHDLKSPLNRLRGEAELLLTNGGEERDWQRAAAMVVEECDRLVGMIDTMLEIARANAGVTELETTTLDLASLAREAYELFEPVAEDKNVQFDYIAPDGPVLVQGDKSRLQRLIANLLDNAIKFTHEGGRVNLAVGRQGRGALLRVTDTGNGIPQPDLARVFDRFFRCDASRATPGNGLGLSLVLAIANLHSGRVDVESRPGSGSSFSLFLPACPPGG
jgi:signal transduction histidine kinase